MKILTIIIGTILLSASVVSAASLVTYRDKYDKSLDTIVVENGIEMRKLGKQYTRGLDSLLGEVKKAGNLDETTSVLDEIERFQKEKAMPDQTPQLVNLINMQALYTKKATALEVDKAEKIINLAKKYDRVLHRRQKSLVTAGQLDEARAIQDERSKVESSQAIVDARQTLLEYEKASIEPQKQVETKAEEDPATPETYSWSFDGSGLKAFVIEDDGSFVESMGKVSAKTYDLGKGWHGPEARVSVSLESDFQLEAKVNYRTQGRELGRVAVGAQLESGEIYTMAIIDNHVSVVGHNIDFTCNKGMLWSTGRKPSKKRFSKYPLTIQRRGDTLSFLVKGKQKGEYKGCDTSAVEEVFFTIQQFSSYPPLTKASISEIQLSPLAK